MKKTLQLLPEEGIEFARFQAKLEGMRIGYSTALQCFLDMRLQEIIKDRKLEPPAQEAPKE